MKKVLVILIALIGFSFHAKAQAAQCKITNSTQSDATVVGSVISTDDDGTVHLTFSSDETTFPVNITYTVSSSSGAFIAKRGTVSVGPNQTVTASINVGRGTRPTDLSIEGARCLK